MDENVLVLSSVIDKNTHLLAANELTKYLLWILKHFYYPIDHKSLEASVLLALGKDITKVEFSPNSHHMPLNILREGPNPCLLSVVIQEVSNLKNLVTLRLGRLDIPTHEGQITGCSKFQKNCQKFLKFPSTLQEFSASGSFVSDTLINSLAASCKELKCLDINRSSVSPKCVEIVTKFEKLEELFISSSQYYFFDDHVRDLLLGLANKINPNTSFPYVKVLQCDNISESNIKFLVEHFPHLEGLHMSNQVNLKFKDISNLKHLKEVGLRDFDTSSYKLICQLKETDKMYFHSMNSLLTDLGSRLSHLKLETCCEEFDMMNILELCPGLRCLHLFILSLPAPTLQDFKRTLPCFESIECISLHIGEKWTYLLLSKCEKLKKIDVWDVNYKILYFILNQDILGNLEDLSWNSNSSELLCEVLGELFTRCKNLKTVSGFYDWKSHYRPAYILSGEDGHGDLLQPKPKRSISEMIFHKNINAIRNFDFFRHELYPTYLL